MKKPLNIATIPTKQLPTIDFQYPMDEEEVSTLKTERTIHDMMHILLIDLIKTKAPLTHTVALCYVFRINMEEVIDKPYTLQNCADYLCISKQSFGEVVRRIRKRYKVSGNR